MSNDRVTIHCNKCGEDTYHSVLFEKREPWDFYDDNVGGISGENRYEVLNCGGCETKSFRHSSQHSEHWDPETNGWEHFVYPPRYSRPIPEWISDLESALKNVLKETYSALNNSQVFLAAFGIRTALDMAMTELVGDLGDMRAKKNEMNLKIFFI